MSCGWSCVQVNKMWTQICYSTANSKKISYKISDQQWLYGNSNRIYCNSISKNSHSIKKIIWWIYTDNRLWLLNNHRVKNKTNKYNFPIQFSQIHEKKKEKWCLVWKHWNVFYLIVRSFQMLKPILRHPLSLGRCLSVYTQSIFVLCELFHHLFSLPSNINFNKHIVLHIVWHT